MRIVAEDRLIDNAAAVGERIRSGLLREWAGRPPAPVLVLTGEIEDDILNEVRALGAVILSKPFSPSKLTAQVAMLVRGRARENA